MHLLIDLGNTRIKWSLVDSNGESHSDGNQANREMLELSDVGHNVESAYISSVAGAELTQQHCDHISSLWHCDIHNIKVAKQFAAFSNNYQALEALGVDRWVAAIGAAVSYPQSSIIVIDAGTAITIDLVCYKNEAHHFEGGVILPGLRLMHESLTGNTAHIQSVFSSQSPLVGRDTQECVNSGVRQAVLGGVTRVVKAMQDQNQATELEIVICGGDAEWFKSEINQAWHHQRNLIFQGLFELMQHHEAGLVG